MDATLAHCDLSFNLDNVLYSNYSETVQIQDARNSDQVDSSTRQPEVRKLFTDTIVSQTLSQ